MLGRDAQSIMHTLLPIPAWRRWLFQVLEIREDVLKEEAKRSQTLYQLYSMWGFFLFLAK